MFYNKDYYIFEDNNKIIAFIKRNIPNGKNNNDTIWEARANLRTSISKLSTGGILQGRFFGNTHAGTDLENVLFFNIGSKCFANLMEEGVAFLEMDENSATYYLQVVENDLDYNRNQSTIGVIDNNWCIYEYSMIKPNPFPLGQSVASVNLEKEDLLAFNIYKSAINCWEKIKGVGWEPRIVNNPVKQFVLDISLNTSKKLNVDKIKHMLDGIISSMQEYNGTYEQQILGILKCPPAWLYDTNILGEGAFVKPPKPNGKRKNLIWNPADDRGTLKGCRIQIGDKTEIKVLV